jgi:methyl-accepting chemotaxis protein
LARLREQIRTRITEINAMTEREVLEAGNSVHGIVARASSHIHQIQEVLSGMTDRSRSETGGHQSGVSAAIAEQSLVLREHVADLTTRAASQDDCARAAWAESAVIVKAAGVIDKLAREARMLALNARIEASRSGGGGGTNGFGVIAEEMQRLAKEVVAANDLVQNVAVRLGDILPAVANQAREIRASAAAFAASSATKITEVEAGVSQLQNEVSETLRASDVAVEAILRSSREALSHLQFQDVAAQQLMQIDGWIHEMQFAEAAGHQPSLVAVVPPMHVEIGGGQSAVYTEDAGEVLLF